MRCFLASLAVGILAPALVVAPASAKSGDAQARDIMKRFAACAVAREPELASQFVLKQIDERLPDRDFQKLVSSACLTRTNPFVASLRMRGAMLRGAFAEELVRVELADEPPADFAAVPPLVWSEPTAPSSVDEKGKAIGQKVMREREAGYLQAVADSYVGRLGECVVRADPAGAKVVVVAQIDTPYELAAMKAMSTTIGSCIVQGETLKFNRTTLRSALAVSYYRLAAAARAARSQRVTG